jgi:hypothetical protein
MTRRSKQLPHALRPTSGERLRSDKNEASVINACTRVVSIACDLFNKLAVGLEDLFVGAVKVNTVGKISQRLVAYPTKDWAFPVRHRQPIVPSITFTCLSSCEGVSAQYPKMPVPTGCPRGWYKLKPL